MGGDSGLFKAGTADRAITVGRSIHFPTGIFFKSLMVYLALCIATFLMLRMVLDYTAFRDDVDFLRFKQAYVGYWWWSERNPSELNLVGRLGSRRPPDQ